MYVGRRFVFVRVCVEVCVRGEGVCVYVCVVMFKGCVSGSA